MPAFDLEDDNSWRLSTFDEYKIEAMEIGDSVELESGNAKILRYKNEYIIMLQHEGKIRKEKELMRSFPTLKQLIAYLKK